MAKAKTPLHEFPCGYGNLNVGDRTCRLAVKIDRSRLPLGKAAGLLCDRRLTAKVVAMKGEGAGPQLPGLKDAIEVSAVFDTRSFAVSSKSIGFGLTAVLESLHGDLETLTHFAKRMGRIEITGVADAPAAEGDGDDE